MIWKKFSDAGKYYFKSDELLVSDGKKVEYYQCYKQDITDSDFLMEDGKTPAIYYIHIVDIPLPEDKLPCLLCLGDTNEFPCKFTCQNKFVFNKGE
jgi:hypothetical protein